MTKLKDAQRAAVAAIKAAHAEVGGSRITVDVGNGPQEVAPYRADKGMFTVWGMLSTYSGYYFDEWNSDGSVRQETTGDAQETISAAKWAEAAAKAILAQAQAA